MIGDEMMYGRRSAFQKPGYSSKARGAPFLCLPLLLVMLGCDSKAPMDSELEKLGRATGPITARKMPPQMPPGQMGQVGNQQLHSGSILEKIDVPKYTYLRIKTSDAKEVWSAIPSNQGLKTGQHVDVVESVLMKDFTSPSLQKTFPTIVFGFLQPEGVDGGTGMGGMRGMGMGMGGMGGMGKMGMGAMKGRPTGPKPGMGAMPPGHPPMNAAKGKHKMGGMPPSKKAADQPQ